MNFLALLGWSPGNDQELFSRDELVAAFSLEGISSSDAVFDPEKLEWFSAQHIARMPVMELVRRIEPRLLRGRLVARRWSPGSSRRMEPRVFLRRSCPGSSDPGEVRAMPAAHGSRNSWSCCVRARSG